MIKIITIILILISPFALNARKIKVDKERPYNNHFFGFYYAPIAHIDFSGVRFPMPINNFDAIYVPDHFGRSGNNGNEVYNGTANVEIPLMGLNYSYYTDNGKNKVHLFSGTLAFQQLSTKFTALPQYTIRANDGRKTTLYTTASIEAIFNSWKLDLDYNWRFTSIAVGKDYGRSNFYIGGGFAFTLNLEDESQSFLLERIRGRGDDKEDDPVNQDHDFIFNNGKDFITIKPDDEVVVGKGNQFADLVETELLVYSFKVNVMGEYFYTLWGTEFGLRMILTANINLGKSHFKFEETQSSVFTVNGAVQLNIPVSIFEPIFSSKGGR